MNESFAVPLEKQQRQSEKALLRAQKLKNSPHLKSLVLEAKDQSLQQRIAKGIEKRGSYNELYKQAATTLNTVEPTKAAKENNPAAGNKIDLLSLGLLDSLEYYLFLEVDHRGRVLTGTLSHLLRRNPTLAPEIIKAALVHTTPLKEEALGIMMETALPVFFTDGKSPLVERFRQFVVEELLVGDESSWLLTRQDIVKMPAENLGELFQISMSESPAWLAKFFLNDSAFDSWKIGRLMGEIRSEEIKAEKRKTEAQQKQTAQKRAELQRTLNLCERDSSQKILQVEKSLAERLLAKNSVQKILAGESEHLPNGALLLVKQEDGNLVFKDYFASEVVGQAQKHFGRRLELWEIGALYTLKKELGLEEDLTPNKLVLVNQYLAHSKSVVEGHFNDLLSQSDPPKRTLDSLTKDEQFWLGANIPAVLFQFAHDRQTFLQSRARQYSDAAQKEELFFSETLGHTEAIREETRDSVQMAFKKTSRLSRALKFAQKIKDQLLFNMEGDSIFHTSVPGKTATEKLKHSLKYMAPGVLTAGVLGLANWTTQGTLNHQVLHGYLPLINGGLIAGTWFLGREASDLSFWQKYKVFGELKWGYLTRSVLRGGLTAGVMAGVNQLLNQYFPGSQTDTPTLLAGLTMGKLVSDQVSTTLGFRTGSESYLNRLFFHKNFVDRAAEILWFGQENLPDRLKKNLEDKRGYKEKRPLIQLADFEGLSRLLGQGRREEFLSANLSQEKVLSLANTMKQLKGELYLLMAHNEARYGRRVITVDSQRVVIDNKQVLQRLDQLKENLWTFANENYSGEILDKLEAILLLNKTEAQTEYNKQRRKRQGIYLATGGALNTLAFGAIRYFSPAKKVVEFAKDLLSGELGLSSDTQLSLGAVSPSWAQAPEYIYNPENQTEIVEELASRFDHLKTLDLQLQSRGLFSGTPTDRIWEENILRNYGLTVSEYETFINKLRAQNLSVEELTYITSSLLKSGKSGVIQDFAKNSSNTPESDLKAIVTYFNQEQIKPKSWLNNLCTLSQINPLVFVERPELATKLGIKIDYLDQLNLLNLSDEEQTKLLSSPQLVHFVESDGQTKVVIKGAETLFVANFMEGLPHDEELHTKAFLRQMQGLLESSPEDLELALNHPYFLQFLAASNSGSADAEIFKKALFNQVDADSASLQKLYAAASLGNTHSYNDLMELCAKRPEVLESVFRKVSSRNLPAYEAVLLAVTNSGEEPKASLQNALIHTSTQLGLQPSSMQIKAEEFNAPSLVSSPSLSANEALVEALDGRIPLESALIAQQTNPSIIFTRNGVVEYVYNSKLQSNVANIPLAKDFLMIEESPWQNDEITFLGRLFKRNLPWASGQSGASDYAMSMIDWVAGGPGQFVMGEEAAFYHRPDQYGLGYLSKLTASLFTDKVPHELEASFQSEIERQKLLAGSEESYNSLIGKLCWKFETYLAAQRLSNIYSPDELAQIYARWVPGGHINGLEIRGWDMMSQVYFGEHFNDLPLHQQHLIFVISQAGDRWSPVNLLSQDYALFAEANKVEIDLEKMSAIERELLDQKVRQYKIETLIERAVDQLNTNATFSQLKTKQPEVWALWMSELDKIKANPNAYFVNKIPSGYWNDEAFKDPEVIRLFESKNGVIILNEKLYADLVKKGLASLSPDGQIIINLPSLNEQTEQVFPNEVFKAKEVDTVTQTEFWVRAFYQKMFAEEMKNHDPATPFNFSFTTKNGEYTGMAPPWVTNLPSSVSGEAAVQLVSPGIATIVVDENFQTLANVDMTGVVTQGPQEFGSAVKPLMVWALSVLEPERYSIAAGRAFSNERFILNGTSIDNFGPLWNNLNTTDRLTLGDDIVLSANRPLVNAMRDYLERHPEDGYQKVQAVLAQVGLKIYFDGDTSGLENKVPHLFELGLVPIGDVSGADKSGAVAFARAYAMLANPEQAFPGKPEQIEAAHQVFDYLSNDENRVTPLAKSVWGGIIPLLSGACGIEDKAICASKTGTADLGYMGIKNITTVTMEKLPNGSMRTLFTIGSGYDGEEQIGLERFGMTGSMEALPTNRVLGEALAQTEKISPVVALNSLDLMFRGQDPEISYKIGKLPAAFVQGGLQDLVGKDYAQMQKEGGFYYVDVIGEPINGVQSIALSVQGEQGREFVTLQVPEGIVQNLDPKAAELSSSSLWKKAFSGSLEGYLKEQRLVPKQTTERLAQLDLMESEVVRLQNHGFNLVAIGPNQNSPLLAGIYASMNKNGFLFAGPEEYASVMKQMGLDPSHTLFVNESMTELYLNSDHGNSILYYLMHQQGYAVFNQIYESAGISDNLEGLMYNGNQVSSARRLLDLYLDTLFYQSNLPIPEERAMLVHKFLALSENKEINLLAPDVIRGYAAFKTLFQQSLTLSPGQSPVISQVQAAELLKGLENFDQTTRPEVLQKLEIVSKNVVKDIFVKPQTLPSQLLEVAATTIPLTESVDSAEINIEQVIGALSQERAATKGTVVNSLSTLNQDFPLVAAAFNQTMNEVDELTLKGKDMAFRQEFAKVRLNELLSNYGLEVQANIDTTWIESTVTAKQCVSAAQALTGFIKQLLPESEIDYNRLGSSGIAEFGENSLTKGNAAGFMGGIKFALKEQGIVDGFYKEWLEKPAVDNFQTGDLFVIKAPNFDSTGHMGVMIHKGVTPSGQAFALFFESNWDGNGSNRLISATDQNLYSILTGYTQDKIDYYQQNNIPLPYIGLIRDVDAVLPQEVASR